MNLVSFISYLTDLNKKLKRKPYTMAKINEMLLKLEVFKYDTSLDLDMAYYHIWLTEDASNLCTTIIPAGESCYKHLLMGLSNSPDTFQLNTNNLFQVFESIHAYID